MPRRVLLVYPQRIGDVLLATPLARSIKQAWPEVQLDMLVFAGTEGVLENNGDIADVIVVSPRAGMIERLRQLQHLWRRYDMAVSALPTDRARIYCWAAGKKRFGVVQPLAKDRAKKWLLHQTLNFDDLDTHTVSMGLRLTELLGIAPCFEVVPPRVLADKLKPLLARLGALGDAPFAVLHAYPKFRYKMWTEAGWIALVQALHARGLGVVLTGSAELAEMNYVEKIGRASPAGTLNLAGTLSLAETAELIRRADLYIGPDTAVTHIAAATGTPTVALFGPSNPVKWGPWPSTWASDTSPWSRVGSGRQGNVTLVQGVAACVPCMLEGCERHLNSRSDCLETMTVGTVLDAMDALLSTTVAPKTIMLKTSETPALTHG